MWNEITFHKIAIINIRRPWGHLIFIRSLLRCWFSKATEMFYIYTCIHETMIRQSRGAYDSECTGVILCNTWWRHQMEKVSALLAICAGNSPVPGEFPTQRPVTRSFDVYFDLRPDKRLSKQLWGWWFETLSHSLWRHRNEISKSLVCVSQLKPWIWHILPCFILRILHVYEAQIWFNEPNECTTRFPCIVA